MIRFEKGFCWLSLEDGLCWVDADSFLQGLKSAQYFKGRGENQKAKAVLSTTLPLYQGGFLQDFLYSDWLTRERNYLQEKWREAVLEQIALLKKTKEYEEASSLLRRALHFEPWREELHQLLISILLLRGKRGEALQQYQKCYQILKEELDLEPDQETKRLLQKITKDWID